MSTEPIQVRAALLDALQIDLIGPSGGLGDHCEVLPQAPSRWYLTGFLVPTDADEDQRYDPNSDDEVDQAPAVATVDENQTPEQAASKRSYLPSSLGLSVLVPSGKQELQVIVRYGEYLRIEPEEGARQGSLPQWRRNPHEEILTIELGNKVPAQGVVPVPNSRGVEVVWSLRGVPDGDTDGGLPKGTQSLSIFVVNRRKASPDEVRDEGFIFQVELEVQSESSFIARPNLHSLESDDWDERVADLQYRNSFEFSVGHSVSTESVVEDGVCKIVRTCHLPTAEVEKVAPAKIDGVTLNMETLAFLRDGQDAMEQLGGFASSYESWIEKQKKGLGGLSQRRQEIASELLRRAGLAAKRIRAGIELLALDDCMEAFRLANKTMAAQGRRRLALQLKVAPEAVTPAWRPFQLAFILMNLKGIAEPASDDRELVDLLFFPTGGGNSLPILSVDEPIYRRLPCFLIATVDKFAAMPWTGEVGAFFGNVNRVDSEGFYGPCDTSSGRPLPVDRLPPPDLVIQDELHLISGPLGTMVGLYETALDSLATVKVDGKEVRPKIIASTATVRRALSQIRSLFNRPDVDVFPPPGPDIRDSFFARTHSVKESNARKYVGIAAQGRSPKVIMLRVYLTLLSAAQKAYDANGGSKVDVNPADPYMTLLGYFNSLRELGGARRLIEDEIRTQLTGRGSRKRLGETDGLFKDRTIAYEPVELTSRVSTDKVSEAKRRLEQAFKEKDRVDVAIATNMISVGLDITRLGLMVCFGQPKTSSEYIQATSRVGRDDKRPGLVVTILNVHRPRDRSHYERFAAFHESFYRSVEATSVTPFSPRALDRGLAGTFIALARHGHAPMTPPRGATEILKEMPRLQFAIEQLANRALETHSNSSSPEAAELRQKVADRCKDLLDTWSTIAKELHDTGGALQYQTETGSAQRLLYEFLNPELKNLPPRHKKFRANRSMRDVEPSVNLWLKTIDGVEIDAEEEQ